MARSSTFWGAPVECSMQLSVLPPYLLYVGGGFAVPPCQEVGVLCRHVRTMLCSTSLALLAHDYRLVTLRGAAPRDTTSLVAAATTRCCTSLHSPRRHGSECAPTRCHISLQHLSCPLICSLVYANATHGRHMRRFTKLSNVDGMELQLQISRYPRGQCRKTSSVILAIS